MAPSALLGMPAELSELPRSAIPLRGRNIVGLEALQGFFSGTRESLPSLPPLVLPDLGLTDLKGLVDELATAEQRPCHGDGQASARPRLPPLSQLGSLIAASRST